MAIRAGTGFIDILPRVSTAAFTGAMNAQMKPAVASFSAGLKSSLAPLAPIIAGVGAVAVGKLTLDFENAFTRISAISNATAEQITKWRDAVFELGQETAIAPQKLADGLYYLASAGLDANQIFPSLAASAKGAAIGLGEMEDITRTVAQVLNAYPDSALKAIDVIDTLTAAVRESTAEPEEFAQALGRVLPIASKAGVGIDELVASLSTLSNIGLDVDEGVTGIRQVLNLIVSPGKQATETLNELGISTEELRRRLEDKGIINTLRFLNRAVGESEDKFRKLLPNIRAMTAAFGLTEQEASKVDGIFQRVADSSGDLGEALTETQEGPGFKFQKAMVSLQSAAIRLGQAFLPIGTEIAAAFVVILGPVTDLLAVIGKLPGVVTALFTAFLAYQALRFVPVLIEAVVVALERLNAVRAADGVIKLANALPLVGAASTTLTLGIGLLAFGLYDANKKAKELDKTVETLAHTLASGKLNEKGVRELFSNQDIPEFAQDKFDEVARRIIQRANQITAAQRKLDREIVHDSETIQRVLVPTFEKNAEILNSMGTSVSGFSTAAVEALHKGDEAFAKFSKGAIGDAAKLISDFHDNAVSNLNFTATALGELSSAATSAQAELATADLSVMDKDDIAILREAADLTAGELLKSFKDARQETKDFGHDLLVISRTGGEAGDRVAEVLLGMGAAGQAAADTIASAGPKMRDALITNFAAGEGAAETLATKLTRRIVGTLEAIQEILENIARAFDIRLELEGDVPVERSLTTIQERLNEIDGYTATAHVTTVFRREGGPAPDVKPEDFVVDPRSTAEGGVVGAAAGGITRRPTILAGEGGYATSFDKGSEAIMPLDDQMLGRLGGAIARAIELPTIIVKVGEAELARTITRGQRRRGQLVGA